MKKKKRKNPGKWEEGGSIGKSEKEQFVSERLNNAMEYWEKRKNKTWAKILAESFGLAVREGYLSKEFVREHLTMWENRDVCRLAFEFVKELAGNMFERARKSGVEGFREDEAWMEQVETYIEQIPWMVPAVELCSTEHARELEKIVIRLEKLHGPH